jgi:hypothetical protein
VRIVSGDKLLRTIKYCSNITGLPSELDLVQGTAANYLSSAKDFTTWSPAGNNTNYYPFINEDLSVGLYEKDTVASMIVEIMYKVER